MREGMQTRDIIVSIGILIGVGGVAVAQQASVLPSSQAAPVEDPVKTLVARLDLERYKATIKGLTQFGDRRQGTDRNLAAVDWIEAQLKSYGCATERIRYVVNPPPPAQPGRAGGPPNPVIASGEIRSAAGGSRLRGITRPTGVNNTPEVATRSAPAHAEYAAEDASARANRSIAPKIGTTRPDEMYIVGRTWTGIGLGAKRQ